MVFFYLGCKDICFLHLYSCWFHSWVPRISCEDNMYINHVLSNSKHNKFIGFKCHCVAISYKVRTIMKQKAVMFGSFFQSKGSIVSKIILWILNLVILHCLIICIERLNLNSLHTAYVDCSPRLIMRVCF